MSALGNLVVSLALDTAAFTKGVDKSSYEAQKFAQDLDRTLNRSLGLASEGFKGFAAGALGAVGVTLSVSAAVTKLNDTFARMDDLLKNSQRFGIQVEELSKLGFAAQMSGVQTDKLGDALKDLLKNAAEAASGSKGPKQAFDALGVSVQDLDGKIKPASKLIEELSGRFSQLPDGAAKSNAAMKIFGESGLALIPMLNAGEEGIRKMNEEAERFGLVVSTDAAKAAELYNDNLARLTAQVDGLFVSVASGLLPTLNDATESFLDAMRAAGGLLNAISAIKNFNVKNFISENITGETLREREVELQKKVKALEAAERRGDLTSNPLALGLDALSGTKFLENFDIEIIKSTADLSAARAELALVTKSLTDAEKNNTDSSNSNSDAQKRSAAQQEEYLKRLKALMAANGSDKSAAAIKNLIDEQVKFAESIQSVIDKESIRGESLKRQLELGRELTDTEKKHIENVQKYGEAIANGLKGQVDYNDSLSELIEIRKTEATFAKTLEESAKKETESLIERSKQLQVEIDRIGLKTEALAELEAQALLTRAAEAREAAEDVGAGFNSQLYAERIRQAEELERQVALVREKSAKEVAIAQIEENNRVAKQFEDDLIDAFEEAFLRGGDFAKSFSRAIEAQFAKMVLRPVIEAVIRGNNPVDALAGSPAAVSSLQAFSNFSSGGVGGVALGGFLSSAEAIGANAILNGYTELGSKIVGVSATLGKVAPYAGSIVQLLQGDVRGAAGSAAGTAIGTAIGNVILPGVGGAIGAALGGLIGGSLVGGNKISATSLGPEFNQNLIDSLQKGYTEAARSLGGAAASVNFGAGGNTGRQGQNANFSLNAVANGRDIFSTGQTADGQADGLFLRGEIALNEKNIAEQTTRAIVAALKLSDFADNIDAVIASLDPLNGEIDALNVGLQNAQILSALNEQFANLEGALGTLSGASIETIGGFLQLVGGLEGLQAGFGAFFDAFYTEQQKTERLTAQVSAAFAQFGQEVPTSRDALVALVDGLNLQDESQGKLLATIFQLTPALDQLLPAFDAVGQSASDNAQALESVADAYARLTNVQLTNEQIAQQRITLEQRLAEVTGGTEAAAAAARAAIAPYNLALYDQVVATEQAQQAIAAAQQQAAAVLQERSGLETRLLQLQGNTAALRQRELAAVDGSNRAILQQIFALEDAQQAQREFAQQVQQTEQALSTAQSRLSSAQSAVASAQSAIDQVRDQATQNYLSTQSRVIAAQQRLNELQNESVRRIQQVGASISEFLNTLRRDRFGTDTPQRVRENLLAEFSSNQIAALSGDAGAAERAQAIASELLGVSKEFFGSTQRFQADLDFVTSELQKIVALGGSAAVEEQSPLIAAQNELALSQAALTEATNLANSIGASLVSSQKDLATSFTEASLRLAQAVLDQADAQAEVTIAQRQLDALNQINGSVGSLNSSLIASLGQLGASLTNSLAQGFESLDLDVDGGISQDEFSQAFASFGLGEKLNAIFSEIDVNGNGLIDRTEAVRAQTEAVNSNTASALNPLGQITGNTGATFNATDALQRFFEQTLNFSGNGLAVSLAANQNTNAVRGVAGLVAEAVTGLSAQQGGLLVRSIQQTVSQPVRFRDGGLVTGPGTGTSDSIPALLSNREFVVNAASTRSVGEDSLKFINRTGRLPANPVGVPVGSNNAEVVAELRALRAEMQRMDNTVAIKVVTPDGKVQREETIRQIRERSRRGEYVVDARGVK